MQCSFILGRIIKISVSWYPKGYFLPMATTDLHFIPRNFAQFLPALSGWGIGTWPGWWRANHRLFQTCYDELVQSSFLLVIGNKGTRLEKPAWPNEYQIMRQQKWCEQTYEAQLSHFNNRALHWWKIITCWVSWVQIQNHSLTGVICGAQPCTGPRS